MKNQSRERIGELYILSSTLLWSLFPIITIFSFSEIGPLFSAGLSTVFSFLFFGIVLSCKKKWHEFQSCTVWKEIFLASFFIGVLFYALFFIGLRFTTAGNGSIISLLEILFSFLIFGIWKKEKYSFTHTCGAFLMLLGGVFVLFPGHLDLNSGDLLIVLAVFIAPFGNHFAQKALAQVSSVFLMFVRSLISSFFLLTLAFWWEDIPSLEGIQGVWIFLFLNGVIQLGVSKIFFLESITRISITKAISFEPIAPALTLVFAYFLLQEVPTMWQIVGFVPIAVGGLLLMKNPSKSIQNPIESH